MASSLKKFQSQTEHKTSYNLSRSTEKKKIPLYTSGEATAWKRPTPKSNWWANAMENTKKCVWKSLETSTRVHNIVVHGTDYYCWWWWCCCRCFRHCKKPSKEEFFTWIGSFSTVKFQSTTDARTVNKLTGNKQETTQHFYFFVVHFIFRHNKKKKQNQNPFDGCWNFCIKSIQIEYISLRLKKNR